MAWLVTMGSQHVGADMLFHQLTTILLDREWEKEILEAYSRLNFYYCLLSRPSDIQRCR